MNYIFNISGLLLASIQSYQRHKTGVGLLSNILKKWALLRHLFWTILTGSDIDPNAKIGARLKLPHPNGVIIHQDVVVGDDCMIMQQVTIGQLATEEVPILGSNVYIGAGAKILGGVKIGDWARVGSNAVVLCDVPAHCTAVGVPAHISSRRVAS
jgi:serine O-acetyltransferase